MILRSKKGQIRERSKTLGVRKQQSASEGPSCLVSVNPSLVSYARSVASSRVLCEKCEPNLPDK